MIKEYFYSTLQNKNAVMFITSILFMAGILSYFNGNEVLVALLISFVGVMLVLFKKLSFKYVIFWIFVFYFGFFNSYFRIKSFDDLLKVAPLDGVIYGQITSIPNYTDDKTKFFLNVEAVDGQKLQAKTYVTLDGNCDYMIGDYVEFPAKVRLPFKSVNPSQFDYGNYLRNYNAFTASYGESGSVKLIENKETQLQWKFMKCLNNVRNGIILSHSKYLKSPNLEILGGVVFGDDAVSPPEYIKNNFINSGLLHILAASGMNVAFIFGFWFYIMRFFRLPYRLNIIGGIVMVILYTLMTGLGASVLRAALMLLFIQVGKLIDRDAHSVSLLSFVAMLLLLYNPAYINNVGFQLSFIVTFGLLTTAKVVFDKMENIKLPDWIKAGFLIPIIAQIWVAPIQMFYFNTFSTYSILANILTVPFLSVVSFGGFVSSILAVFRPIADFVCMVFDFVLKYALDAIVIISDFFAKLPNSMLTTTHPSVIQIAIFYMIVLFVTVMIQVGFNKKLMGVISLSVVLLFMSTLHFSNNKLDIIAFSVGNADAFLIKTPQDKYFIIDTAKQSYKSTTSTARFVISKYLKDRGIKDIEGMVLTHFDLDHAGGAVDLMEDLNIKHVYINSTNKENQTVKKIFDTMEAKQIPFSVVQNNSNMYSETDLVMKNYITNIKDNDNENSVITLLSYKNFDMLFTGDAGVVAFYRVKKDLPHDVEVLKVGHHGGRNVVNPDMINYLGTKVSVVSTGPNSFGHPDKITLDVLKDTDIYRTDKHNSVKITSDGDKYYVYVYDNLKRKYVKQDAYACVL